VHLPSSSALLHSSMFSCFSLFFVFICMSLLIHFLNVSFSCYVCRKWRICKMKQSPKFMPWLTLLSLLGDAAQVHWAISLCNHKSELSSL
jgi:hypothetical protein